MSAIIALLKWMKSMFDLLRNTMTPISGVSWLGIMVILLIFSIFIGFYTRVTNSLQVEALKRYHGDRITERAKSRKAKEVYNDIVKK